MEPITDWFEFELLFSVPSAALPLTSLSSFIPILLCCFAGTSHLVCTSTLRSDGTPVFYFLEQNHICNRLLFFVGTFHEVTKLYEFKLQHKVKKKKVLLLSCSSTFLASCLNECGHYWLTHSRPAVCQWSLMDNSSPIQMRNGIGRQLRT